MCHFDSFYISIKNVRSEPACFHAVGIHQSLFVVSLMIRFLFFHPNSFNHHTLIGHDTDYLNLALRDGGVSLTMGLANGKQEMHIKPARVRFDDHQWHKVTVHRRIQEVKKLSLSLTYSTHAMSVPYSNSCTRITHTPRTHTHTALMSFPSLHAKTK